MVARVGPAPREKLASGWGYYLGDAAIAGVLCFGPPQGQKVTFVHPDDWLGPQQRVGAGGGSARGGAPLRGDVRAGHAPASSGNGSARVSFTPERTSAFLDEPDCELPSDTAAASVRLLPEYDAT